MSSVWPARRPTAAVALRAFSRPATAGLPQRLLVAARPGTDSAAASKPSSIASRSRLEAVLYLAREPLTLRKLAQMANLADATEARTVLNNLRERYDKRGCAFQVAQVAGGFQLFSRREFAQWL